MKKKLLATVLSVASLSAGAVFSVGPDSGGSSTQDYSFILDSGNSVSITQSSSNLKISGTHPSGYTINDGSKANSNTNIQAKWDYNGTSIGLTTSSPYLADVTYTDGILTNTSAKVTSNETAVVVSRSMGNGVKFFGGLRLNQFKANINYPWVGGAANPTFAVAGGYQFALDSGTTTGFAIGAAYEVPQILLRASIQYNSEIKHLNAKVTETLPGAGTTASNPNDLVAPSSMIIKLRSALSPRMLAFANWRSSQYKKFRVHGPVYTGISGGDLYDPESGTDYTLGLGLKINEQLNVIVGTGRGQATDTGGLANALIPFKGSTFNFIGGSLKVNDRVELNAGYSVLTLGDDTASVPDGAAPFTDNNGTRLSIGTKVSF